MARRVTDVASISNCPAISGRDYDRISRGMIALFVCRGWVRVQEMQDMEMCLCLYLLNSRLSIHVSALLFVVSRSPLQAKDENSFDFSRCADFLYTHFAKGWFYLASNSPQASLIIFQGERGRGVRWSSCQRGRATSLSLTRCAFSDPTRRALVHLSLSSSYLFLFLHSSSSICLRSSSSSSSPSHSRRLRSNCVTLRTERVYARGNATNPSTSDHWFAPVLSGMHALMVTGSLVASIFSPTSHVVFATGTSAPCTSIFKPLWVDSVIPGMCTRMNIAYNKVCDW